MSAHTFAPAAALIVAIAVTGCTGGEDEPKADNSSTSIPSFSVSPFTPSGPPADPTTAGPTTKKFGDRTTYEDGAGIIIGKPTQTSIDGKDYAVLDVTAENHTPSAAPMQFWFFEGEVDGSKVQLLNNSAKKIGVPEKMIAQGGQEKFKIAFPCKPGQKLKVKVIWRDGTPFTYQD